MSRFLTKRFSALKPYVPGEQPKDMKYIKLNTNESPYPPDKTVEEAVRGEAEKLRLYSDPDNLLLREEIAKTYGVGTNQVTVTNGSDETLNFAFAAFADELVFPDITYGFYPVVADFNNIPFEKIPLEDDFRIDVQKYMNTGKTVVIANPNAPTGIALDLAEIERIVSSNRENIVIVDEAYVDFGAQSAVKLTDKYDNLLVVQTFSKSRSLAGARIGFAIGAKALIKDLNTVKDSTNPYNVNRMSAAAGRAALLADGYYRSNCREIIRTREETKERLENLGFTVTESKANFLFAKSDVVDGETLYKKLKERGILVRHFNIERIADYNRITIGTPQNMQIFINETENILKECGYEKG